MFQSLHYKSDLPGEKLHPLIWLQSCDSHAHNAEHCPP